MHLYSVVSSRQPYVLEKPTNILAADIRRIKEKVFFSKWTLIILKRNYNSEKNTILKEQVCSLYNNKRKTNKLWNSVLQTEKQKLVGSSKYFPSNIFLLALNYFFRGFISQPLKPLWVVSSSSFYTFIKTAKFLFTLS